MLASDIFVAVVDVGVVVWSTAVVAILTVVVCIVFMSAILWQPAALRLSACRCHYCGSCFHSFCPLFPVCYCEGRW